MLAQHPQVTDPTHRLFGNLREVIDRILLWIDEIAHKGVDLGRLEAGDVDVEVALGK